MTKEPLTAADAEACFNAQLARDINQMSAELLAFVPRIREIHREYLTALKLLDVELEPYIDHLPSAELWVFAHKQGVSNNLRDIINEKHPELMAILHRHAESGQKWASAEAQLEQEFCTEGGNNRQFQILREAILNKHPSVRKPAFNPTAPGTSTTAEPS